MGILLESGLVILALALAAFGIYDHQQQLTDWSVHFRVMPVVTGIICTLPLLVALVAMDHFSFGFAKEISGICDRLLVPLFQKMPIWKMLVISLAAGFGEELLFRWCLQGGLREWLGPSQSSLIIALIAGSVLFGVCHWINMTYAIVATLIGIYLGAIMELTDTVFSSMITHALYDFLALVYLVYIRKPSGKHRTRMRRRVVDESQSPVDDELVGQNG